MTPIVEFMDVLVKTAEEKCSLLHPISLDELPPDGGIYAEPGEGFTETTYYDKTEIKTVPGLILCRDASQKNCMEQLESICNYSQKLKKYPNGDTFSWLGTAIAKYPSKIGRDADGVYHYSCILRCKLYF